MTAAGIVSGVFRAVEYAGLLGFIGVVVMRRLGAQPPHLGWARPGMERALALAFVGGGLAVAMAPSWLGGIRVALELAALVFCLRWGPGAVPAGFAAVLLVGLAGHVQPDGPSIFVAELHVLSAGMWAGGVVVLATLQPPRGWRGVEGQDLLTRFGRVAFVAFAFTGLTGLLRAGEELTGLEDLWTTAYGVVLLLKSAGVLAMLVMAAITWRRGVPLARTDAVAALVVMVATGLLAAFPTPPAGA
ncbi:MAG TPA: CopD family protein [Candidatus Dormibacteraeota bacterium]|nr:CopD family protein [Candidatus Dormibacteraeota bacterium]